MTKITPLFFLFPLILLTLFSYLFVDPGLSYLRIFYAGFFSNQRLITTIVFVSLIFVSFVLYFVLLKFMSEKKIGWSLVKKIIFFSSLILFFSYPAMVSFDIFNYTTTAKVLFGYFENPYIVMPIEFLNDNFLSYTHAANKTALYGPFWLLLTGIPYLLSSWNFIFMMFAFKFIPAIFYFLTLTFIDKLTKDKFAVIFFSLNPLVLIETFISAHNDIVMMFFAFLSIYLLKKQKFSLSYVSLILSVLIKFATAILMPVYIYAIWANLKRKQIDWRKIYLTSAGLMFVIFLLSPIREEIYPWYFIWILAFVALTKNIKLYIVCGIFSFFLMLRYVPFMYLGTHFGITPLFKIGITFGPLLFILGILSYLSLNPKRGK